jgi:hypothetical protein
MKKFETGVITETIGVHNKRQEDMNFNDFAVSSLQRHLNGDWGDLCEEDKRANDFALRNGDDRLFSKYNFDEDTSIYIITEWDRSATTILFPDEY